MGLEACRPEKAAGFCAAAFIHSRNFCKEVSAVAKKCDELPFKPSKLALLHIKIEPYVPT
jgi:hypothetical protein